MEPTDTAGMPTTPEFKVAPQDASGVRWGGIAPVAVLALVLLATGSLRPAPRAVSLADSPSR